MRARLALVAVVLALPLAAAVACGGSETPPKTGGDEKPTGDDTSSTATTSETTTSTKSTETSKPSTASDEGPSAGDYASMPIVTCGKTKCAQGQICTTLACRPSEPKCPEVKVCATPLNYKP
jgi:cytoskeletal protein RodZ